MGTSHTRVKMLVGQHRLRYGPRAPKIAQTPKKAVEGVSVYLLLLLL